MTDENPDTGFDFDEVYEHAAWAAAERNGFAVSRPVGPITSRQRLARVEGRRATAHDAVVDLQQWLVDDDFDVRTAARSALRAVIATVYTGDRSERDIEHPEGRGVDSALRLLLFRHHDPDGPRPWWEERRARSRIRGRMIEAALTLSIATATLLYFRQFWLALVSLAIGAAFDISEGSFARLFRMRDARLRWKSCILSHLGDMLMLSSIAASVAVRDHRDNYAVLLLGATLLAMFGSLVRTSAMQAGYRFWRSSAERWTRYCSVVFFCVLAGLGLADVGLLIVSATLSLFGAVEVARVLVGVERMPLVVSGAMNFVDSSHTMHSYAITDAGEAYDWECVDDAKPDVDPVVVGSGRQGL